MQASSVPGKFSIPFANGAGSSFVRSIPTASQIGVTGGAASLTDGFPPLCFSPVAAGGVPPWGQDMNGILRQVTQWNQWQQAGAPIVYDSAFQSAIGGYPAGAIIQISAGGAEFTSTVDNNTVAPAVGAAGWMPAPTFGANVTTVSATGSLTANNAGLVLVNASAGNITLTLPSVSSESGTPLPFVFARTDTSGNTVTLAAASGNTFLHSGAGTFPLAGNTAAQFVGNGASAWQLTGGIFFAGSNIWTGANTFNNPVTVATATASGQAMNLGQLPLQFQSYLSVNGYKYYPDNTSPTGYFIEQWGKGLFPTQLTTTANFPLTFPNTVLNFVASLGASINLTTFTSCGGEAINNSQFNISVGAPSGGSDTVWWSAKGY